jgi:hypothetical protein
MIYAATAKSPPRVPGTIDPDSTRIIGLIYRPATWVTATVYYARGADDYDIVIPTVFKGMYFKATNPGKSGATEPVWPTTIGGTVTDGGIVWEAVAYNLMVPSETITASTWSATDGVVMSGSSFTGSTTQAMIASIPANISSFSVTNHTTKSTTETNDTTLIFQVAQR